MASSNFKSSMQRIRQNIEKFTDERLDDARVIADGVADEGRNWMKANASWQDQTGAARESLDTEVDETDQHIIIRFFYDMEVLLNHAGNDRSRDYSPYLEEGRFSILIPAINLWTRELVSRLKNLG